MQKYDCTIQYKPGKEMVLANHLSCFPSLKESLPIPIHQNIQHVQLSTDKLDAIQGAIECDLVYYSMPNPQGMAQPPQAGPAYCLTLLGHPG